MAPERAGASRSSGTLLSVTLLLLAARLSLDTRSRAFAAQGPRRPGRFPAVALRAEKSGLVVVRDPERIKEQLLDAPSKALVAALEQAQEQSPRIASMKELEGTWELRGPKASSRDGLRTGDLPRAVLGLYQGQLGRILNMEVLSPPRVTIAASGATEILSRLRWGRQRDEILLQGRLTLTSESTLREDILSTRSTTLRMKLPTLSRPRELKVTYFDGDLLVLRDSSGMTDVLVRQGRRRQEPPQAARDAAADAEPQEIAVQVEVGSQADQLLSEVERLKVQLQAQRDAAAEQRSTRSNLQREVQKLETVVADAAVKAKADSVKLTVMEDLKNKVSEDTRSQQERSGEKERARRELLAEVKTLEDEAAGLEERASQHAIREESLRRQISALEQGLIAGPRDQWPGYRAALETARAELKDVRSEIRSTNNVVARVRSSLQQKMKLESKVLPVVEAEVAAHRKLEAQLGAQQRELEEQKESLGETEAAEQALRRELEQAKQQLDLLEAREAEGRARAAQVEREIEEVVAQVGEAAKAAKGLGASMRTGARKFWPFR